MAEDIKETIKEYKEETLRHFDVVAEDLRSTVTQIAEGVSTNADAIYQLTERIDGVEAHLNQLQGVRVSIESMREDVKRIRFDLSVIDGKLSKKPGHDDLVAIDKRVWRLEQKIQES